MVIGAQPSNVSLIDRSETGGCVSVPKSWKTPEKTDMARKKGGFVAVEVLLRILMETHHESCKKSPKTTSLI